MGLKKLFKKAIKINKDVLSGKLVKKAATAGVSFAQKNPELVAAVATGGVAGALDYAKKFALAQAKSSGYLPPDEDIGESYPTPGSPVTPSQSPAFPAGLDQKTILIGAGAIVALVLLTRK